MLPRHAYLSATMLALAATMSEDDLDAPPDLWSKPLGRAMVDDMRADEEAGAVVRGQGGRCAAGWLFEGEAGKDFEEGAFATAPNIYALLKASGHDPYFVSDLQEAHDDAARLCQGRPGPWLKEWADDMRCIAYDHGLSTAALDAALAARSTGE